MRSNLNYDSVKFLKNDIGKMVFMLPNPVWEHTFETEMTFERRG